MLDAQRDGAAAAGTGEDLARRTGRFANLWRVVDIALLGGRLLLLQPTDPDPHAGHDEFELVDGVLRSDRAPDLGSGSQSVEQARDAAGVVTSVRTGGITHRPLEALLAERAASAR